jgi:hypothetical protein
LWPPAQIVDVHADPRLHKAASRAGHRTAANYGVEFYTPNGETQYHNAPVSALDLLALKRLPGGGRLGVVGGWIQQFGNDTGGARQRHGR